MNNRKRMIVKSCEVCYRHSHMDKCSRRMWLSYSQKYMVVQMKDIIDWWLKQPHTIKE